MTASPPLNEAARLDALHQYQLLDTPPEEVFDALTRLAAHICATPASAVTLIDADRQWLKSRVGLDITETTRDSSFCTQTILDKEMMIVPDTHDHPCFSQNSFVTAAPHIRFYAGVPLVTPDGHALGSLCVIDYVPRVLNPQQIEALTLLAAEVMTQLELRRERLRLEPLSDRLELILDTVGEGICGMDNAGCITFANPAAARMLGRPVNELLGRPAHQMFYSAAAPPSAELYATLRDGQRHQLENEQFCSPQGVCFFAKYTSTPILRHGVLEGAVLVFEDISTRKRAEEELRLSQERYRSLYDDNPLIYFTLDKEGIVLSINRFGAEFLGYRVDELVGFPGRKVVLEEDKVHVRQKFLAGLRNPQQTSYWEVRKMRKNGTIVWAKEAMRVMQDSLGNSVALIVCQDITDLKHAEASLQKQQEFLKAVLENIEDGIIACDAEGTLTLFNHAARKFHGLPEEPLPPHLWAQHYNWYMADAQTRMQTDESPLFRALQGETVRALEMTIVRKPDSVVRNIVCDGQPLLDAQGQKLGALAVLHDVTKRKRAEQRLNYLANYDPLTELPNRSLFNDSLNQGMANAIEQGTLVAVLFLNLDRFKRVNDSLGHALGDLLLKIVSQRLARCVREGDSLTRLSGDEFALILTGIAQVSGVTRAAQRIIDAFALPFQLETHEVFITPSIGISIYPSSTDGDDAETLLQNADAAMYRAKELGRNGFQFYIPETTKSTKSSERATLEIALRTALERDEMRVHYQPLIALQGMRIVGVEALLRWQRPGVGMVPRAQFVPVAEETGLILPLGIWTLYSACRQCKTWQDRGLPPLRVALKLSARQFQQQDLVAIIVQVLAETGIAASHLELQLTESIFQNAEAGKALQALRDLGVQIAIDDYGTGHSSLSILKQLPVDKLKIDQSFIRGVPQNAHNVAVSSAIVRIAHSMKLKVMAEGVETAEQLEFLHALGCDEAQGYFFSKPLPAEELVKLLTGDTEPAPVKKTARTLRHKAPQVTR